MRLAPVITVSRRRAPHGALSRSQRPSGGSAMRRTSRQTCRSASTASPRPMILSGTRAFVRLHTNVLGLSDASLPAALQCSKGRAVFRRLYCLFCSSTARALIACYNSFSPRILHEYLFIPRGLNSFLTSGIALAIRSINNTLSNMCAY